MYCDVMEPNCQFVLVLLDSALVVTTAISVLDSSSWYMAANVQASGSVFNMVHPFLINLVYCRTTEQTVSRCVTGLHQGPKVQGTKR